MLQERKASDLARRVVLQADEGSGHITGVTAVSDAGFHLDLGRAR